MFLLEREQDLFGERAGILEALVCHENVGRELAVRPGAPSASAVEPHTSFLGAAYGRWELGGTLSIPGPHSDSIGAGREDDVKGGKRSDNGRPGWAGISQSAMNMQALASSEEARIGQHSRVIAMESREMKHRRPGGWGWCRGHGHGHGRRPNQSECQSITDPSRRATEYSVVRLSGWSPHL